MEHKNAKYLPERYIEHLQERQGKILDVLAREFSIPPKSDLLSKQGQKPKSLD